MTHDNREGLKGWIRTIWFPYIERVPDATRDEFIEECFDDYFQSFPLNAEGSTHVAMMRLEVAASK